MPVIPSSTCLLTKRGWCRLELLCNGLSPRNKPLLVAESRSEVRSYSPVGLSLHTWFHCLVGKAAFSVEDDRRALGPVVEKLIVRRPSLLGALRALRKDGGGRASCWQPRRGYSQEQAPRLPPSRLSAGCNILASSQRQMWTRMIRLLLARGADATRRFSYLMLSALYFVCLRCHVENTEALSHYSSRSAADRAEGCKRNQAAASLRAINSASALL